MTRTQVTPHLDVDLDAEAWVCRHCDADLGEADESYKRGCLVAERDPSEVHRPTVEGEYTFAPDPEWCRIVEFYCPDCGAMIENEYLPPGHPISDDIDLDLESLRQRVSGGDNAVADDGGR